jgi:hypothetical protein
VFAERKEWLWYLLRSVGFIFSGNGKNWFLVEKMRVG